MRTPPSGIHRAAEVVLRFAGGALAHVSIATTHRAQPVLAIAGDTGEIDAIGTLGARGEGIVVHRARGATAALPFVPENPYLRQLRVFAARCAGIGPRHDHDTIANARLLESISSP